VKSRVFQLKNTLLPLFISGALVACNSQPTQQSQSGQCPQTRTTEYAPASIAGQGNPLSSNEKNVAAGEKLYQSSAAPVACAQCHGEDGDGNGVMANMFEPAPRNFTCSEIVGGLPDGQLFWIIKNGSIGTSMPAFDKLTDEQIWQLTIYLRSFEIKPATDVNTSESKQTSSSALNSY
jgi:mono/diheme cytochrome c family protein